MDAIAVDRDWLARAVVHAAPEAIVACDPGGLITLWNGGAERIFGYSETEALGQSLDLIIGEKQRARHWAGYDKTMATGHTKYGDALLKVPAVHRDGRRLSIEFSVALLRSTGGNGAGGNGADGKIVGIAAVIRDVTERWAAERELRQRLAEAERTLRSRGAAGAAAELLGRSRHCRGSAGMTRAAPERPGPALEWPGRGLTG